ncbi:MAG: carbohydrate kinase family protein [Planctomycetota bacterium]
MSTAAKIDCLACGSCTVDILVRPVDLTSPLHAGKLHRVEPIELTIGGISCNASITQSRLGLRSGVFSATGDDRWGQIIRESLQQEQVDCTGLRQFSGVPSSVSVVAVDDEGGRSFIHSQGAPKKLRAADYLGSLDLFASSRYMLIGYYPLLPGMLDDLPTLFAAIQETGCRTAMDAAGGGGEWEPLRRTLPYLDVYCPSLDEARQQTGHEDPKKILETFRRATDNTCLGVKLGDQGALLSPADGQFVSIDPVSPPGPVVDTTGAGDAFFAGFLAGLILKMSAEDAGRLAAAAGAQSVVAAGATTSATTLSALQSLTTKS